jgi:serine/threonine-protein kinase
MLSLFHFLEVPFKHGTILKNRYKIVAFIGKGSYGLVYRAFDQQTGQIVVVKQARNRKKKEREGLLQRVADVLSSLTHPSIPAWIDFFYENRKSFLVMDWMQGENVEDLIFRDRKQYSEEESLQLLLCVLNVVHYLHEHQIIHRDLRIPNVLINEQEVFIIDLGLAIQFGEKINDTLLNSMSLEKRLYREPSVTSDFYALGHFLLFLLYSSYDQTSSKEQSWEEELSIHSDTKKLIKKLLKVDNNYQDVNEITSDIQTIINQL